MVAPAQKGDLGVLRNADDRQQVEVAAETSALDELAEVMAKMVIVTCCRFPILRCCARRMPPAIRYVFCKASRTGRFVITGPVDRRAPPPMEAILPPPE